MALENECDTKAAFRNGIWCLVNDESEKARYWFNIAINDEEYREAVIAKLIKLDIKEGKYDQARELVNTYVTDQSGALLFQAKGLLDTVESNFEHSKMSYGICMDDVSMQYKSLLALAKLNFQTGDYAIAKKMFQTLQFNPDTYIQATFGLIFMNIYQKNYEEALRLLKSFDKSNATPELLQHYKVNLNYVEYLLGISNLEIQDGIYLDGYIFQVLCSNDRALLEHIDRHKNQGDRYTTGCFFKDLNTRRLLADARDIIKEMNGNHFELSDMYRFRLDRPVGYKNDEVTNDVCVTTMIGTNNIITMYPVKLSDEFNKEGLNTSEELKLKRSKGV